ncbi:hypothetical protein [Kitasatospora sp. NPDC004531]
MRTLNVPSAARWAIAVLAPLALIVLGVLAANPDCAGVADPARAAVLALSLLALAAFRIGRLRVVLGAAAGFVLCLAPSWICANEVLRLRGERTDLVIAAAQPGAKYPCVYRRTDGRPLPHDVYEHADCVPDANPAPFPYLVDPAGWVPARPYDGSERDAPEVPVVALAVAAALWFAVVPVHGRRPDRTRAQPIGSVARSA